MLVALYLLYRNVRLGKKAVFFSWCCQPVLNWWSWASSFWSHSLSVAIEILIKGWLCPNIKGWTSANVWEKAKVSLSLSLCVCSSFCLFCSNCRKNKIIYHIAFIQNWTELVCRSSGFLFSNTKLLSVSFLWLHTWKDFRKLQWGYLLPGCVVACNVFAHGGHSYVAYCCGNMFRRITAFVQTNSEGEDSQRNPPGVLAQRMLHMHVQFSLCSSIS